MDASTRTDFSVAACATDARNVTFDWPGRARIEKGTCTCLLLLASFTSTAPEDGLEPSNTSHLNLSPAFTEVGQTSEETVTLFTASESTKSLVPDGNLALTTAYPEKDGFAVTANAALVCPDRIVTDFGALSSPCVIERGTFKELFGGVETATVHCVLPRG